MELLSPIHPYHSLARDSLSGFSPSESFRRGFDLPSCSRVMPEITNWPLGGSGEKVHLAVGKSMEKAVALIRWSLERFPGREICLVHVHRPSPLIPTLLGKLPASQANAEVVSAYRRQEREQMKKLLQNYLTRCCIFKVKASTFTVEADQVHKGIIDLVDKYSIRRLVIGAIPENCATVKKRSSSKANYAVKNAPSFCEILFVYKGKHIWTRDVSESEEPFILEARGQSQTQPESVEVVRCRSLQDTTSEAVESHGYLHSTSTNISSSGITNWLHGGSVYPETTVLDAKRCIHNCQENICSPSSGSACSGPYAERRSCSYSEFKVEEEGLCHLAEALVQVEASRNEAFQELMKRTRLEQESMEAINKVKALEVAYARECKIRKDIEEASESTLREQETLLEEKEEVARELQRTMASVALLDSRAQEATCRRDEVAGELQVIREYIATLRIEKQGLRKQNNEAADWLDRWRSEKRRAKAVKCYGPVGIGEDLPDLAEFSFLEIQSATCDFSESFKVGESGNGCVFKGEMLGRTVAIKKLHPHNVQGQFEFQKEVQVLGRLLHPHVVTLLGACPEAWCLVYEYLPNGSLLDRLLLKGNCPPLTWRQRIHILFETSRALCFLHSSQPERIVHGDLKPENILLDSDLRCKICDIGICRLVSEENPRCSSFRRVTEPKSAFPFTDPEFYRNGVLTPKSDVYSFGLIILQVVTGRPPVGLVGEVRRAVACGKLDAILDSSAGEWPVSVARRLVDIGLQCSESQSRSRPDLTPCLVRDLEQLLGSEERPVPSFFLCPILQEIMHDPQIAADGFTYEGDALLGWLENGRETSPMTNLPLGHLHLTPNHALRQAIQDWLCNTN